MPPPPVVCRYFLHGNCTEGDRCRFSHTVRFDKRDAAAASSAPPCSFFAQGRCKNGAFCRFSHAVDGHAVPGHHSGPPAAAESARAPPSRPIVQPMQFAEAPVDGAPADAPGTAAAPVDAPLPADSWASGGGSRLLVNYVAHGTPAAPGGGDDAAAADAAAAAAEADEPSIFTNGSNAFDAFVQEDRDEYAATALCPYNVRGECQFGATCRHVHGLRCPHCAKFCLHPDNADAAADHVLACEVRQRQRRARQASSMYECAICFDNIVEAGRRFGLLSNCNHAMCLPCLRSWRTAADQAENVVRACPICRSLSYYITPSWYMPRSAAEKAELQDEYRAKMGTIPCKHFARGQGECPFGTSCFYAHLLPDGTPASRPDVRTYVDADGQLNFSKGINFGSFLEDLPVTRSRRR